MVLVVLALTSLARRLFISFLTPVGNRRPKRAATNHGVSGDAACASSRQQILTELEN